MFQFLYFLFKSVRAFWYYAGCIISLIRLYQITNMLDIVSEFWYNCAMNRKPNSYQILKYDRNLQDLPKKWQNLEGNWLHFSTQNAKTSQIHSTSHQVIRLSVYYYLGWHLQTVLVVIFCLTLIITLCSVTVCSLCKSLHTVLLLFWTSLAGNLSHWSFLLLQLRMD